MAKVVNMPKMGEAMEEGQIVSWMYEEGDGQSEDFSVERRRD